MRRLRRPAMVGLPSAETEPSRLDERGVPSQSQPSAPRPRTSTITAESGALRIPHDNTRYAGPALLTDMLRHAGEHSIDAVPRRVEKIDRSVARNSNVKIS